MKYKTGKLPPSPVSLKFNQVFNVSALPTPPRVFGHEGLVSSWGMLGNDQYGDCVCAGACHETMVWSAEGGQPAHFTEADALRLYSQVTGFNPINPFSDMGTDAVAAASYRQKTGLLDTNGVAHKIDAYAELSIGDVDQHAIATYLFGAVGFGLVLPSNAETLFENGEVWDVPKAGHATNDGHYVSIVGRNSKGNFVIVTWGRLHAMTPAFLNTYNDQSLAYLSHEVIKNNVSPENYDAALLAQYLKEV